ncbi:tetratricopeptide repeat protein [Paraburkholderia dinghuensis]|uniref:Tetratricopeptide repeat protein n=1 Tax=Paraburkholderia dinghuensis TaxID=2305225 RepID=A0A3N6P3D8_9BURK|nr:tetratricopeptide repeat protein [Paraburkholderia dinghuensis]
MAEPDHLHVLDYEACKVIEKSGRYREALSRVTNLLVSEPLHVEALELAAICLHNVQEQAEMESERTGGDAGIDLAVAFNNLGCWFYAGSQVVLAEQAYRRALNLRPDSPDVMTNLGIVLKAQHREPEAESILLAALEIAPADARAHNSYGLVLWKLKRLAQAEKEYREAIRLKPDFRDAYNNLGLLLLELNRPDEAEVAIRRALSLDDTTPEAYNNLGNSLRQQGRTSESIAAYRQALALRPGYVAAKANLAHSLLSIGEYKEGWALYESRHDAAMGTHFTEAPRVPWPRWRGEPLAGKSLLVWPEQGYGDVLQFCRYLPLLKASGADQLGIVCPPVLQRLFGSLEGVDAVYPMDGKSHIPRHDHWCFVMSLPYFFGTTVETIPATMPYLRPPEGLATEWKRRLPSGGFKVGLVWAGNPRLHTPASNAVDQRRSMSSRMFVPILQTPGVTFVSLQKGETAQRQIHELPRDVRPLDLMDDVQDFADTAAIVECLDLVITVDTSIAHLAGALNKPVWILSRYDSCWRWLCDRDDSPWYPRARLFRQIEPGNWDEVVGRVANALACLPKPTV